MNVQQAADIVGVSLRTIYYWVEHGKVECWHTPGGGVRIFRDSLVRPKKPRNPRNQPAA